MSRHIRVGTFEQGGFITMRLMIGYVSGGLAVVMIVFSIRDAAAGGGEGMVPLLAGLALMLAAAAALRSSETRV